MNVNERNSNFEFLRIILILMIITLHYINGDIGGLLYNVDIGSFNYYLSHFLESFCIIAVNVFVIITGYFSYKKTSIKISKVLKLFLLSIFYGLVISIGIILFKKIPIDISVIKQIVSTCFSRWFVVIYCILYLLIPYINKIVHSINEKQLRTLIIINVIFFYIWPSFFTMTTLTDNGYGIINFVNLYLIGVYIRLYKDSFNKMFVSIIVFLLSTGITFWFSLNSNWAWYVPTHWDYSFIFNLISSVSFFLIFKNIKIKNNKFINKLASYSFAIYIIHENSFLRKILYRDIFNSDLYWNRKSMIINLVITVIGIYIVCVVIEFIRRVLFKRVVDNNIDKVKKENSCE